ncbi:MAG: hypothetical protein GY710_01260 [Desulfobacteraceae bacterium]|nr:hypothetical protein [Desulfobacteraceae bacterium]
MTDPLCQPMERDMQEKCQKIGQYGSVEKAIAGEYDFEIGAVLQEAWKLTKGMKGSIFLALLISQGISFLLTFGIGYLFHDSAIASIFSNLMVGIILMPMSIGVMMIGINRAVQRPFSFSMIFNYYGFFIPLVLYTILSYIFIGIGFLLLIIPGIYLSIAFMFAAPLIVEKKMGVMEALETSRKAVTKKWFTFFLIGLFFLIIIVISAIPIGIGLIWTIPMGYLIYGILYRNMFGVE